MRGSIKYIFWAVIFICCLQSGASGREFITNDSLPESNPTAKKASRHALFLGSGYGSNLLVAGSSVSDNMAFLSANITYSYMQNIWASVVLYNLPSHAATIPLYDISAGYNHTFNDWFDISASISSFQASQQMQEMLYPDFAFLTFALGVDWMLLYTQTSLGKILDQNTGIYLYVSNSRYISTPEFGKAKSYFSLDPSVNLLFGNYNQVTTIQRTRPFMRPRFRVFNYEEITTTFRLTQIEFSIPVAFNTGRFSIEAEPLYLLPTVNNEVYSSLKGFHFFFNLDYQIF